MIDSGGGEKRWRNEEGQYHRTDGPAIDRGGGGYRAWYVNGQRHRADGPAIEWTDYRAWYVNGQRHRTDGPAIERADGSKSWYVQGRKMTEAAFNEWRVQEEERRQDDRREDSITGAYEGLPVDTQIVPGGPVTPMKRGTKSGKKSQAPKGDAGAVKP